MFFVPGVRVTEFESNDRFDILIGLDIITIGDFSITNHNGKTVVSFRIPSDTYHIDYVEMLNSNRAAKNNRDRLKKAQTRKH
jgi:hypothetical protein